MHFSLYQHDSSDLGNLDYSLLQTKKCIFPGLVWDLPTRYNDWTEQQFRHIRFCLIKFFANYKNKRTGEDVTPSTMKKYMLGIQRGFCMNWGYDLNLTSGPIFNCPKEGIFFVVDNKASEQQRVGKHVFSHNVL